jgi:hypothetical protein
MAVCKREKNFTLADATFLLQVRLKGVVPSGTNYQEWKLSLASAKPLMLALKKFIRCYAAALCIKTHIMIMCDGRDLT